MTFSQSCLHTPLRPPVAATWTSLGTSESGSGDVGCLRDHNEWGGEGGQGKVGVPEVRSHDAAQVSGTYGESTYLRPEP